MKTFIAFYSLVLRAIQNCFGFTLPCSLIDLRKTQVIILTNQMQRQSQSRRTGQVSFPTLGTGCECLFCILIGSLCMVMIVAEISSENALCLIATENGDAECTQNEFGNALSFFIEEVDVNCKDDELNAIFYTRRAACHFSVGEFTR